MAAEQIRPDRRGSLALHGRSAVPSGSQTHTLGPASGSSVPDQSTGDPSTNNGVRGHCEARTDREQCRSSAPDGLRGPHRQDETRRTVDLGHSSDGPSWIDLAENRVITTGITLRGLSQLTLATKSANIRHATCELTPVLPAVSWLSISATVERAYRPRVVSGDCTATESLQDQVCNAPSNCVACLTSEVSNPSVNDAHRGPSNSRHSPLRPW